MEQPMMTKSEALAALAKMTDDDFPTVMPELDIDEQAVASLVEAGRALASGRPSLTAPGEHSPRLSFRVPQSLKTRLAETARRQGRRESDVARDALSEYLGEPVAA